MIRNGEGSLESASHRLNQALDTLETRLQERPSAPAGDGAAGDGDSERLRAELTAAREREKALEEAAAEASAALGRAAEHIRIALDEDAQEA